MSNHINRRDLLKMSTAAMASVSASSATALTALTIETTQNTVPSELLKKDALEQARLVNSGEISAKELAQASIDQIRRTNHKLNAVVAEQFDEAISASVVGLPTGVFSGVPYLIKDLADYKGMKTSQGSRFFMRRSDVSASSDVFVERAIQSGFNVLGKTNTPEFGLSPTTESLALGPSYNPWDLRRSSGGSSGGAAAAVASGMVAIAQGSDGGGSIRIPASCCGIFGLKPSRYRNVWSGHLAVRGFDIKGHLSRSVRDTAAALAVTERQDGSAPYAKLGYVATPNNRRLKIGVHTQGLSGAMPETEVAHAISATADLCESLGHKVEKVSLPVDYDVYREAFLAVMSEGVGQLLNHLENSMQRKMSALDFEPLSLYLGRYFSRLETGAVDKAAHFFKQLALSMESMFDCFDVILSPVLSRIPPTIGELGPTVPGDTLIESALSYIDYTPLYNGTGQPSMSVPLYWTEDGLPIGSQFSAGLGQEKTLLELAYELEQARPWANRWPA